MEDEPPPMEYERPYVQLLRVPPPIHPTDDPSSPPPESILLDPYGYLSDRTNHTTADGFTSDSKRIRVTFWAAHPPRVSCFTVHCPDLPPSEFGDSPAILATEDDIVLLRVPICVRSRSLTPEGNDYFVYQARPPSLKRIPAPPLKEMAHRLRSPKKRPYAGASKAITIGGKLGSLGWVDLGQGILIADVLHCQSDHLRYVPLPEPLVPGYRHKLPMGTWVRQGTVKGWLASKMRIKDSWKNWESVCKIEVIGDMVRSDHSSAQLQLNPEMGEPVEKPVLKGRFSGYPVLSLHEADVVYLTDRHDLCGEGKGTVIAVDMRKCTLKGVADFECGRPLGTDSAWIQSGISKHLNVCSTSRFVGNAESNGNGIAQAGTHAAETNRNGIAQAVTDAAETSRKGCKHNKKGKGKKA
ncbi:hypothetical protein ACP4OV_023462 [Aristida adscensionis]